MSRKRQQKASDDAPGKLEPGTCVCLVKGTTGSNVFECWDGSESFLVELPPRFRKLIWIRRGSFVIVKSYDALPEGPTFKIHGEITTVLLSDDIKRWKRQGLWPTQLDVKSPHLEETERGEQAASPSLPSQSIVREDEGEEDNDPLWENSNRK